MIFCLFFFIFFLGGGAVAPNDDDDMVMLMTVMRFLDEVSLYSWLTVCVQQVKALPLGQMNW